MAQCHKNGSIAVWAIRESSSKCRSIRAPVCGKNWFIPASSLPMERSTSILFTRFKILFYTEPLLSLPNPILTPGHNFIHYDNKATSKNPPPPRNFTWRRFASVKVDVPGTPGPKKRPLFRRPPISSPLLSFFLELIPSPSLSSQLAALYNGCKVNAIGRAGRVNVSSVSDGVSGFRLIDFTVRSRSAEDFEPFPFGTPFSCKF